MSFEIHNENDMEKNYRRMVASVKSMLADENDLIANLSNTSSLINAYMDRLNWAGFYILKGDELVLGPFQGLPACTRIKMGRGVCGKAALDRRVISVENVHVFPGHIACDAKTNSELVIPIYRNEGIYGVLDLDSPEISRFGDLEVRYMTIVGELVTNFLNSHTFGRNA